MYRVIKAFTDLQDNKYPYNAGDEFPREGVEVSEDRLEELATDKNRRKEPLIEKVAEEASPVPPVASEESESTDVPPSTEKPRERKRKAKEK